MRKARREYCKILEGKDTRKLSIILLLISATVFPVPYNRKARYENSLIAEYKAARSRKRKALQIHLKALALLNTSPMATIPTKRANKVPKEIIA